MLRQNSADLATAQAGHRAQILELRGQSAAVAGLGSLPELVKSLTETQRTIAERSKPLLIDQKGLGKPFSFAGDESQFQRWAHNVSSVVHFSCLPEHRDRAGLER